jgi:hypothetical protein
MVKYKRLRKYLQEYDKAVSRGEADKFLKRHDTTPLRILELKRRLKYNYVKTGSNEPGKEIKKPHQKTRLMVPRGHKFSKYQGKTGTRNLEKRQTLSDSEFRHLDSFVLPTDIGKKRHWGSSKHAPTGRKKRGKRKRRN